jgi:hypothetical protein
MSCPSHEVEVISQQQISALSRANLEDMLYTMLADACKVDSVNIANLSRAKVVEGKGVIAIAQNFTGRYT